MTTAGLKKHEARAFAKIAPNTTCPQLAFRRNKEGKLEAHCLIYEDRPQFCRDYPGVPEDLIEGCGFEIIEVLGDDCDLGLGHGHHGGIHGNAPNAPCPQNEQG